MSGLRARSKKRARLMRNERVPLVKEMLAGGPPCALGARHGEAVSATLMSSAFVTAVCQGQADCVHERRKRSQGGSLVKRANLVALCSACNGLIESNAGVARLAHEIGLVVRRGDPEWEELGNG